MPNDPDAKRAQFETIALPFMTALYNAADMAAEVALMRQRASDALVL